MDKPKEPAFIYSQDFEKYSYPPGALFVTQRAVKTRKLLVSLGLLGSECGRESVPVPATDKDLQKFHTPRYIEALQRAADGIVTRESLSMGLDAPDCPVFKDVYAYACLACGASLKGAELILSGETDIAFNPSGGFHHAKPEKASGFCYLNDLVLACKRFLNKGKRVLYLDLDAHHGDGVQEAFYSSNEVMVISLHESGKTLWPGTGYENENGQGAGKGFNINIPLPIGICDQSYLEVFHKIVTPLIEAYAPDIFVLQLGMDALADDPLAHLELTNNTHADIIDHILRFNKPILATGGGGYHVDHTVRGWALAWKIMCRQSDENDFFSGMGGVMLQNTEWSGGLRDRVLPTVERHRKLVKAAVHETIRLLTRYVFKYHGI